MSNKYTYSVDDSYNIFGAGHNYYLQLFKNGEQIDYWYFDTIIGMGGIRLRMKINKLERVYGAVRA